VVRWLSDSAYWVYLVHLPIVALMMIVMKDWPVGPWVKFLIIVTAASVLTLVSYQQLVRYTVIGRWLNGPRTRPGTQTDS
ncbi:MAG: 2,3,4,5-tetrahydropyridine-2,6-carboxylate N-succinyltransferase, partial [Planctomycetota bacterium]